MLKKGILVKKESFSLISQTLDETKNNYCHLSEPKHD